MKPLEKKTKACIALIGVILILVGCIGACLVKTSFGSVSLIDMQIPDSGGTYIHATVFKPDSATIDTPAPVVVTCHGYSDTGEKQDFAAIELSRRGVVVFEIDALSHGLSGTSTFPSSPASTFGEGCGMISVINFIGNAGIDYIDTSKIGVTGHSMGGLATSAVIEYFGGLETAALEEAKLPDSDGGADITDEEQAHAESLNLVSAAFMQSALPQADVAAYGNYYINAGLNYTFYDEGNFSTTLKNGDMRVAPEALAFINSTLDEKDYISEVEIGHYYGNAAENNLRVVNNVKTTHTFEYMTPASATCLVDFFDTCFDFNSAIPVSSHIFLLRYVFTTLALIGLAMLVTSFVAIALSIKALGSVVKPVPSAKARLDTKNDKLFFWGSWVFTILVTFFCLVPVIRLDKVFFPEVANMGYVKTFTSVNVNSFAIWCVFIALVTLVIFLLNYYLRLKKMGWTVDDLGVKASFTDVIKAIAIALCTAVMFYFVVFLAQFLFHTEFRIWNIAAKVFTPGKLWMFVQYLPLFFIYMFVLSLTTNSVNRIVDQKNNLLINILGNTVGLLLIGIFAYTYLFSTGISFPAWSNAWDRIAQVFAFIAYNTATTIISRKCFEKTGSIWTGTFVNSFIVTMMLVCNTSNFLQLG